MTWELGGVGGRGQGAVSAWLTPSVTKRGQLGGLGFLIVGKEAFRPEKSHQCTSINPNYLFDPGL